MLLAVQQKPLSCRTFRLPNWVASTIRVLTGCIDQARSLNFLGLRIHTDLQEHSRWLLEDRAEPNQETLAVPLHRVSPPNPPRISSTWGNPGRQQKLRRFDGAASFLTAGNTFHVLGKIGLHDLHKSGIQLHPSRRVGLHRRKILGSRDVPSLEF
jgi:hypothetical protein